MKKSTPKPRVIHIILDDCPDCGGHTEKDPNGKCSNDTCPSLKDESYSFLNKNYVMVSEKPRVIHVILDEEELNYLLNPAPGVKPPYEITWREGDDIEIRIRKESFEECNEDPDARAKNEDTYYETVKKGCWRCGKDSIRTFSHAGGNSILEKETCKKCGDLR